MTPPRVYIMLFLEAKLGRNLLCISLMRRPSDVLCCWSVGENTKRRLLCSPVQVGSNLSFLDTVSHISSFHDNFKEVNAILSKTEEDTKF